MSRLAKGLALTRERGLHEPWAETTARIAQVMAQANQARSMRTIGNHLTTRLDARLVGEVEPGRLAALLAPLLASLFTGASALRYA